ncbi:MAG: DUF898 family protein [Clostridiales bacterium]|jgi:uncharacterized membrane protein YjgN (DUF898 family)|nr:DUF898 family protein [Clostridiales bacterium]
MKRCPNCGKPHYDDVNFCGICGQSLEDKRKQCPNCGKVYEDEETVFCEVCGNRLERISGASSITYENTVSEESSEVTLSEVVFLTETAETAENATNTDSDGVSGAILPVVISAPVMNSNVGAALPAVGAAVLSTVVSAPTSSATVPTVGQSKFDGSIFGLIGVKIVQMLLTGITLGIGYPWAIAYGEKWIAGHTVIDGRRLTFTGTGGSLIGQYIKWWLLGIITFGIYMLWMPINMRKWVVKHTVIEGGQAGESRFDGGLFALIGIKILNKIALIITVIAVVTLFGKLGLGATFGEIIINLVFAVGALGFLLPWTFCVYHKWMTTRTVINGQRLTFDGKTTDLFKQYLKWFALSIITCGIYAFALGIKMKQWVVKNISGLGGYSEGNVSGTAILTTKSKNIFGFTIVGVVVFALLALFIPPLSLYFGEPLVGMVLLFSGGIVIILYIIRIFTWN